jgi:hypothetical protein
MSNFWFRAAPALMAAALVVSACGGGSPQDPPAGGGDGGAVQIRGGERLGWIQAAPSESAIRAHQFTLFVDGVPASMSDVTCGAGSASGYDCSGRLPSMPPGRHLLEVASTWNGLQSARSPALTVMVLSAQQTSIATESHSAPEGFTSAVACADGSENVCYDVSMVATGLREVAALTATADGRLLFIEEQRMVRVAERDVLLPQPAYAVERPADRIAGIGADPATERGSIVFVAWTEAGADGSLSLNVSRFREVLGILGEGATIVTGLPFPEGAAAPLEVDDDGMLYLALPKLEARDAGRRDTAFNGFVLRFDSDGGVPAINPRPSPVLANGLARPAELAFDRARRQMWLADGDRAAGSFALEPPANASWPYRLEVAPRSGSPLETAHFGRLGNVVSMARRPDGNLYVAVQGGNEMFSVLLLTRR